MNNQRKININSKFSLLNITITIKYYDTNKTNVSTKKSTK